MWHTSESLKWSVKTYIADSVDLRGKEAEGLRICPSNMFPELMLMLLVWKPHFEKHGSKDEIKLNSMKGKCMFITTHLNIFNF